MNYRLMARFLGFVFAGTGLLMVFSLLWALWFWEPRAIMGLLSAMGTSVALGGVLILLGRKASTQLYQREALALVGLAWVGAAFVGGLPYWFAGEMTFVDALFESTSGFTTTGASILIDIEAMPLGLLFWRSFTQWLGGMGIILLFIAILPYLGAGGKQLFRSETPGLDPRGLKPRIRESATVLWTIYLMLTLIQTALMTLCGMDFFHALCYTFSSVSTGGFAPHNDSVAHHGNFLMEWIVIAVMVIAGTNFGLFFDLRKGDYRSLLRDPEWRTYIGILVVATVVITLNLTGWFGTSYETHAAPEGETLRFEHTQHTPVDAIRVAAFQVTSMLTGTGFATDNFNEWPPLSKMILVVLMFVGGCAGSTSGGLKVVRVILMLKIAYWRLEKTFRPKTVRALRLGNAIIDDETQRTLASFMVIYGVWMAIGFVLLSALGLPYETATTAVITTINIVGPGLDLVGPDAAFAIIPPLGKIYLCLCMILGRLELFTITVLFVPAFWRIGR